MDDRLAHPPRWEHAPDALLGIAATDLDEGDRPLPTLLAFAGSEPLAFATLRPFGSGEVVQALVELLALLLPVGADRIAVSLPGRVWSTLDPIEPVCDDGDLRTSIVLLVTADASTMPCTVTTSLHPWEPDGDGWRWGEPAPVDDRPQAPLVDALRVLLDARDELAVGPDDQLRLAAQLGRVLLLGHQLVLAPGPARQLELATIG